MKTAVYPGSFDPITYGHIDVIKRGLKIFDKIIVGVGNNTSKQHLFTQAERVELATQALKDLSNVTVKPFDGLLLTFVQDQQSQIILRGLRAVTDFDNEFQHALLQRKLNEHIESVFIMTKDEYSFLTSSRVKEIAQLQGDVSQFVPENVEKKLKEQVSRTY